MATITTTTYEYDDEGRLIKTVTTTEPQKPSYRIGDPPPDSWYDPRSRWVGAPLPYLTWTGTTVKVTGE